MFGHKKTAIMAALIVFINGCSFVKTLPPDVEYINYALISADYYQTHRINNNPDLEEENDLLGSHPSSRTINTFFAAQYALTYSMNRTKYKNHWNTYVLFSKGATVISNTYVLSNH